MAIDNSAIASVPLYGAVIQEALGRNDPEEMASVALRAREYLAHAEQVKVELAKLEAHMAQSAAVVPYGPAIQEAIKSGDRAQMEKVAAAAEAHLKRAAEIRDALELLKSEIAKG
jgi:Domain of unknown function (DUF1843)